MLPAGFHFQRYIDGPGLYLGDRAVAAACLANYDPDSPWRLCLNPTGLPRYVFTRTEAGATRYMEAWAVKWEAAIREAVERGRNGREPSAVTGGGEHVDTTHPRRGSRRKMRLPP
ncbi:hypothetical protein [Lysobacter panacisoli]|uniref:Uncharacterized protein n=1 Tax=Lysobacter panacisoli TaxID=1255263 RepID=A0ABP9LFG6_9GAMM